MLPSEDAQRVNANRSYGTKKCRRNNAITKRYPIKIHIYLIISFQPKMGTKVIFGGAHLYNSPSSLLMIWKKLI